MDHQLVFLGGLHRSGTSLLHALLRAHPDVSGFHGTGVPEDEGQHLQTVFPAAKVFGGPGHFAFDPGSFMDESHPLATPESAGRLFSDWSRYWDLGKRCLVEKSPPNVVRTRFFQKLFPGAAFVVILRHPIAVSYATQKWSESPIASLLEHSLRCYERFRADRPHLARVFVLRYEELVADPARTVGEVVAWLGLPQMEPPANVRREINDAYFRMWRDGVDVGTDGVRADTGELARRFSARAASFGYRMDAPEELLELPWLGPGPGAP